MRFQLIYTDTAGSFRTIMESDGSSLKTSIRGIDFEGSNFDALEPVVPTPVNMEGMKLASFGLTDCTLEIDMPVNVMIDGKIKTQLLHLVLLLKDGHTPLRTAFTMTIDGITYNDGIIHETDLSFEQSFIALQHNLPAYMKIHTCLFCAFSNYWIAGNDCFGSLLCFKNIKEKIVTVTYKHDYAALATPGSCQQIQETWHCNEFEYVRPGQWQYKDQI